MRTARAKPCAPDTREWDFRFVNPKEWHPIVVYEYARSCPWVRPIWENWLNEEFQVLASDGRAKSRPPGCIRDAIQRHFDSPVPVWEGDGVEAKTLMFRLPSVLAQACLDYLVWCTPSFPVRWDQLPEDEKSAALSLCPDSRPPFRDLARPLWSADSKFTVAVDLGVDFKELRDAADRWLTAKKDAYQKERRRMDESPDNSAKRKNPHNPGRAAAPRLEALSFLGAYRLFEAGITKVDDAIRIMDDRVKERKDPSSERFPVLRTPEMDDALWKRWYRNAQRTMVGMFKGRTFTPPNCRLPWPRWKP
jgi:hypothetical protein